VKPATLMRRLPWSMVAAAVMLIILGWLGIARSEQLREEMTGRAVGYLRPQMIYSFLAVAAMLAASMANYRLLIRYSYAILLVSLVLLAAAYFFPAINGAHRWIRIGPVGLQPSEFAKVAFVLALAQYLMYRENYRRLRGLVAPLALSMAPILLVLKEPDLGMSLVFLPVLFVMLFVAGARRNDLIKVMLLGMLLLPLLWTQMSREQKSRVVALFDQPAADGRPSDAAYHLHQAKRLRALGGVWGSYLASQPTDDASVYYLPEAATDFVFCVLGERFGLFGSAAVLGLFAFLVWRGSAIAAATREPYGRLVAAGLSSMLGVQVLINTAMTVGLLPITGLPLPLVSYGGSALLAHGMALGLLLNIAARPGYEVTREPFRYAVGSPRVVTR
jgi:rod shape determining protein RodA